RLGQPDFRRLAPQLRVGGPHGRPPRPPVVVVGRGDVQRMVRQRVRHALDDNFKARYQALQRAQADAESSRWQLPQTRRFYAEERLALAQYRATHSSARWLLVSTPENYQISLVNGLWGRQRESEIGNHR